MAPGEYHLDRLLPRHDAERGLDLTWNVRQVRTGFRKTEEQSTPATIRNLSLEGALVEVTATEDHEVGTQVDVRFRGIDGRAQIRHRQPGADGEILYGVRFFPESGLGAVVIEAVGQLRGHAEELDSAWNRRN
jgi:hypothetical protein